jgi:GntR family transcriptional regulator of arabinose operon
MADSILLASKYEQMVDILKAAIEGGDFPEGSRITSENELSRKYGISRNTIREAISSLVQQGYLSRTQGKGTFVTSRRPRATPSSDSYAIFLHAQSHVYDVEARLLVGAFQRAGALPIVFDTGEIKDEKQMEDILLKLFDQGVLGMVIEDSYMPLLKKLAGQGKVIPPLAVVNYGGGPGEFRVASVSSNFEAGTRMGTRHLVGLGHRRILFVIHRYRFGAPDLDVESLQGLYGEAVRGYASAMAEAGLADRKEYFFVDSEFRVAGDRDRMAAILRGPDRPDAVFAFGDYRAKQVIDIAAEIGLRVPEDLAVIGYYNTPWAEMTRVPLTSVSINETEIASLAAAKLLEARSPGSWHSERLVVEPRLVVRQSCGAGLKVQA